jgi:hypothetical protein
LGVSPHGGLDRCPAQYGDTNAEALLTIDIGSEITYRGHRFRVVGVSPMSAAQRSVILEDLQTKVRLETDIAEAAEFRQSDTPDLRATDRG